MDTPCAIKIVLPDVVVIQPHSHSCATCLLRAVGAAACFGGRAAAVAAAAAGAGAVQGGIVLKGVGLALKYDLLVVAHELERPVFSRNLSKSNRFMLCRWWRLSGGGGDYPLKKRAESLRLIVN